MPLVPTPVLDAPVLDAPVVDAPVLDVVAPLLGVDTETAVCQCGHGQDAHEHYRPGSDCALCDCPRFRRKR